MRKFSKVFLSCTAAAALTAGIATSAMAADANSGMTLKATYSEAEGKGQITISECASSDQIKTLLVLKNNKSLTDFAKEDILQIDQGANVYTVTVPTVRDEDKPATYKVYVGGTSGNVYSGTCEISAGGGGVVSTRLLGDITGEGDIDGFDLLELAKHLGEIVTLEGDSLQAADATDDGEVDGFDILDLAKYFGELQSNVDGEKTISDKQHMVSVN